MAGLAQRLLVRPLIPLGARQALVDVIDLFGLGLASLRQAVPAQRLLSEDPAAVLDAGAAALAAMCIGAWSRTRRKNSGTAYLGRELRLWASRLLKR